MKIYVTGIGIISSIGENCLESEKSILLNKSGLSKSKEYNLHFGQVPMPNEELISLLKVNEENISRTTLLGIAAAKEAWGTNVHNSKINTGLVSSTSVGGLDKMEQSYFEYLSDSSKDISDRMVHDNSRSTEHIAKKLQIKGYVNTISTACSSGANAILYGARLIKRGVLDRVLVGGVDSITKFNVYGFNSLNIYDNDVCKPFDENRKGLNLGEGAGYLVLESDKSIEITGNKKIVQLTGWNNSTDAYHQTASSPEGKGAVSSMQKALKLAGINAAEINYVNAHGTGTINNDSSELIALKKVFGEKLPNIGSTKGFTGHTLAAAGAIESIFSVLTIQKQVIPGNVNLELPMEKGLPIESKSKPAQINHVLCNSFGFGGNCTSLIFSRL